MLPRGVGRPLEDLVALAAGERMTLAIDPTPVDVALRDGSTVRVRPVVETDQDGLRALLDRLSPESRWLRFFSAGANLDAMARWAASRAGGRGYGVVAVAGRSGSSATPPTCG